MLLPFCVWDGNTTHFICCDLILNTVEDVIANLFLWWMVKPLYIPVDVGWCYCHGSWCYCQASCRLYWLMLLSWYQMLLLPIYRFVGWCYCHGSWCYCHLNPECVDWCYWHGGRCYNHPGCVCCLAGVKSRCGWWNYHRSAFVLNLVLRCQAEPHLKCVADGICQCFY